MGEVAAVEGGWAFREKRRRGPQTWHTVGKWSNLQPGPGGQCAAPARSVRDANSAALHCLFGAGHLATRVTRCKLPSACLISNHTPATPPRLPRLRSFPAFISSTEANFCHSHSLVRRTSHLPAHPGALSNTSPIPPPTVNKVSVINSRSHSHSKIASSHTSIRDEFHPSIHSPMRPLPPPSHLFPPHCLLPQLPPAARAPNTVPPPDHSKRRRSPPGFLRPPRRSYNHKGTGGHLPQRLDPPYDCRRRPRVR